MSAAVDFDHVSTVYFLQFLGALERPFFFGGGPSLLPVGLILRLASDDINEHPKQDQSRKDETGHKLGGTMKMFVCF